MIIDNMDTTLDEKDGCVELELNAKFKFKTIDDIDKAYDIINALLACAEVSLKKMKDDNEKGKKSK